MWICHLDDWEKGRNPISLNGVAMLLIRPKVRAPARVPDRNAEEQTEVAIIDVVGERGQAVGRPW